MRRFFALFTIILLVLAFVAIIPVQAFQEDDDGIIEAGEVIDDDVFISAEQVIVDGTVNGNLFANGADIIVNGTVNGNLLAFGAKVKVNGAINGSIAFAGQSMAMNGQVNGSVYAAGASVVLGSQAEITHNLYFTGFSLETQSGSQVGIDVSAQCYQVIITGDIGRNISGHMSAFELHGSVGGNIEITVDSQGSTGMKYDFGGLPSAIPSGIRIADDATVGGEVIYTSTSKQSDQIALPDNQIRFEQIEAKEQLTLPKLFMNRLLDAGRNFVSLLILGALALWLIPIPLQQTSQASRKLLPSLGWGILVALVLPITIILAATIIFVAGLLLSVVTLGKLAFLVFMISSSLLVLTIALITLFIFFGSNLIVAKMVGDWLFKLFLPTYHVHALFPLIVGIFLYVCFASIPFAGLLVSLVVSLIGTGAVWQVVQKAVQNRSALPELAGSTEMEEESR